MRVGHRPHDTEADFSENRAARPLFAQQGSDSRRVKLELTYTNETPLFWYMRDERTSTLGKNLSQEPWTLQFWKYCLTRSKNHGHYESWGRLQGTIKVRPSPLTCSLLYFFPLSPLTLHLPPVSLLSYMPTPTPDTFPSRFSRAPQVGNAKAKRYDFGTFRDHSWDVRRWQAIDHLLIMLLELEEPIKLSSDPGAPSCESSFIILRCVLVRPL